MSLHKNSQQQGEIDSYAAFIRSYPMTTLNPNSAAEDIQEAAAIADLLCHWLDRHRAADLISKRVDVHVDLIFKLMLIGEG